MLLTALFGSTLVVAFAVRVSEMLVSPINTLHNGMERVSRGDCDSKILFPRRIKGDEIYLMARIVCIADAFDAMTPQRSYRKKAMTKEEDVEELKDKSGTQFDSEIVKVFATLPEQELQNYLVTNS